MTLKQSSKQNTIKLTKPVVAIEAGEISSTTQDTTLWPDVNGNKVSQGKLALSTSSSTTITNAQTVYPELWANSPAAWQSGSDLVIPQQTSTIPRQVSGTITADQAGYTVNIGEWYAVKTGFSVIMRIVLDFSWNSPADTTPTFTLNSMPSDFAFNLAGGSNDNKAVIVHRLDAGAYAEATIFPRSSFSIAVYRNTALSGFTGTGNWSTGHPTLGRSITFSYEVTQVDVGNGTPTISLYNNIAAGALGLPEATSTQAGIVTKNKWQRKNLSANVTTDTTIVADLSFNNLTIGKTYKYYAQLRLFQDASDGSVNFLINHDGATISASFPNHPDGADTHPMTTIFTATATSITFQIGSVTSGTILQSTSANRTYAILEELNNYEAATTDFT